MGSEVRLRPHGGCLQCCCSSHVISVYELWDAKLVSTALHCPYAAQQEKEELQLHRCQYVPTKCTRCSRPRLLLISLQERDQSSQQQAYGPLLACLRQEFCLRSSARNQISSGRRRIECYSYKRDRWFYSMMFEFSIAGDKVDLPRWFCSQHLKRPAATPVVCDRPVLTKTCSDRASSCGIQTRYKGHSNESLGGQGHPF